MDTVFGLILLLLLGVVTWCVASEGAWGAALDFLCVLFAGLLTMNFFEPLAAFIERRGGDFVLPYADLIAFAGLFAFFVFIGRAVTEVISPVDIEMEPRVYQALRWLFAAAAGYTTIAILLTAVHTAPLPREFMGFRPEGNNLLEIAAPDRQWLGFAQYVSENVLHRGRIFDGPDWGDIPGSNNQHVWPSYPIRYATRRDDLAGGSLRKATTGSLPAAGGSPGAPVTKPQF